MTTTPRLGLTQLEEGQALPEAVVNEADLILEMFATRLIVLSKGDNAPAGGEDDGDAYLVGSSGTGAFLGHDDELALRINGAWEFRTPLEGMEIEVLDEDTSYVLRGGSWVNLASGGSIEVLDEGVSETAALVSLNFTGAGVTATDDGSGNVEVAISGGAGTGAMELIEEKTPGAVATITFSSIPGTYRSLKLIWIIRSAVAATSDTVSLQFNGDTGSNYDRQLISGAASTASASESLAATSAAIANVAGSTAPSGAAGVGEMVIPYYTDTNFQKGGASTFTYRTGTGTGNVIARVIGIDWRSTAAITSITLAMSGNYASGSKIALYGIT